jgi:hypothetical protein
MTLEPFDYRLRYPIELPPWFDPVPPYMIKVFDEVQLAKIARIQVEHQVQVLHSQLKVLEQTQELLSEFG